MVQEDPAATALVVGRPDVGEGRAFELVVSPQLACDSDRVLSCRYASRVIAGVAQKTAYSGAIDLSGVSKSNARRPC